MSTQTTNYPDFVTDADRSDWDALSHERQQHYLNMAEYLRKEYPDIPLSMTWIDTAITFGA